MSEPPRPSGRGGWSGRVHRISSRLYGPRRGLEGLSWVGDERIAIGALPVGAAAEGLPDLGITHVVNCRSRFQTAISQDLAAERRVLGPGNVVTAPMWDNGRRQSPVLWAHAALFAANALEDPTSGVLIHCQQGRRRSVLVAYAVLRLRGHDPAEAARLILSSRAQAVLVPAYRASVEDWLAGRQDALP
jgi:protein-tyrosine phosphatase